MQTKQNKTKVHLIGLLLIMILIWQFWNYFVGLERQKKWVKISMLLGIRVLVWEKLRWNPQVKKNLGDYIYAYVSQLSVHGTGSEPMTRHWQWECLVPRS